MPSRSSARVQRDIIVMAASAGGVEALQTILRALPANLPAAVFVVLHRSAAPDSVLERVIGDGLKVTRAEDGGRITTSHVFVAPPDRHLLLEGNCMRVQFGPKENGHRPAADVLFHSAAAVHGARVIGVVLTGALSDGAAGLAAIESHGGLAIVQDPADAFHAGMPSSALAATRVDHVLPLQAIAAQLVRLARSRSRQPSPARRPSAPAIPRGEPAQTLICPGCGGGLREIPRSTPPRYRCHTGHTFTLPALAHEQRQTLEAALWTAVRILKERATLLRRLAGKTKNAGFLRQAEEMEQKAREIEASIPMVAR